MKSVPIDRATTLKNAEKLLRQGKADAAIEEYLRVVEEFPRDWATANVLGDLYVRARRVNDAVDQFLSIAEGLKEEGQSAKAGAVYKKILKLVPDHEPALLQAATVALADGAAAEAKGHLNAVARLRQARGDVPGVVEIKVRLASLDPDDVAARLEGARARLQINDSDAAIADFGELAEHLLREQRLSEAIAILEEAVTVSPAGDAVSNVRNRLFAAYLDAADYEKARVSATAPGQLKALASRLESAGRKDDALDALAEAARLDPADRPLREQLARAYLAGGDRVSAAAYVTEEIAGNDPDLLVLLAETYLRAGRADAGLPVLRRLLANGQQYSSVIAGLAAALADSSPDIAFGVVSLAVDAGVASSDWTGAMAALKTFIDAKPGHVPALMRLVEVGVDAGNETETFAAQGRLADAYLAEGSAVEARFIAEDLVAREPWQREHIDRLRRALELSGEADPDAIIAERLSGDTSSVSFESVDPAVPAAPPARETLAAPEPIALVDPAPVSASSPGPEADTGEIDLMPDLESYFAGLRADAAVESAVDDAAESQYERGLRMLEGGALDEAVQALEGAARAPRFRFLAASRLARICRDRGHHPQAIEWFERAAEAPPPTRDDGRAVLYELADLLESVGESSRALAVCMELYAEAGEYRDVSSRMSRLAKVQAGGAR